MTRTPRGDRETGPTGEAAAADFFRRLGYRVEQQNLRTIHGEIDLLLRRARTWVAVEVKSSRSHPAPERTVSPAQLRRVAAALRALAPGLRPRPRHLRVDVVAVRLADPTAGQDHQIVHFRDAVDLGALPP